MNPRVFETLVVGVLVVALTALPTFAGVARSQSIGFDSGNVVKDEVINLPADDETDDVSCESGNGTDDCEGKLLMLKLKYTGEGCSASNNPQEGKANCEDVGNGFEPVDIVIGEGSEIYAEVQDVMIGDIIVATATQAGADHFSSNTPYDIGDGLEVGEFHTSCSKPLAVGDKFGSLMVVEVTSTQGGTVGIASDDLFCEISKAAVVEDEGVLLIAGTFCEDPAVYVGQSGGEFVEADLLSAELNLIEVVLPGDIEEPETCVVRVECPCETCTIDVAVGAGEGAMGPTGPQGPQGKVGPQGEKGDKGDAGETGADGATGSQGEKGDTGEAGVQGEKGDKGDAGETGADGATGPQGPQGKIGPQGDKGDAGETGAQGEKGDKGDTGDTGATGSQGPQGKIGPQGDKGDKGDAGETGAQGEKGDKGDTGDTGATGSQGPQGKIGPQGDKGDKGDAGETGAQGEKGDKGDTGETGATGSQGPQGKIGPQGDKGDKGDAGETGAQGEKGDKGDTGATGSQGPQGKIGPQGDKGDTGETGAVGPTGAKGDKGDQGETGLQGLPGPQGVKGDDGDTGPEGPTGPQGPSGCAADMVQIGDWCIDRFIQGLDPVDSPPATFEDAAQACHSLQKNVCPIEALMLCDMIEPEGSSCTLATDQSTLKIWSSTFDASYEAGLFNSIVVYGEDNKAFQASSTDHYPFYCCSAAAIPLAVGDDQ